MAGLPLKPPRVIIQALGCRTNQYEAEALGSMFWERGWEVTESAPWDLGVVVSCSVTAVAERKSRTLLRRFQRACPEAKRILCGCYGQNLIRTGSLLDEAHVVVGNRIKYRIPQIGEALLKGEPVEPCHSLREHPRHWESWDELSLKRLFWHTRGFVKVQDGCDHFCSYCIISHLRGNPVSRPEQSILNEIETLTAQGCPEIILTGIHLGRYQGSPGQEPLGILVQKIGALPGVKRIRFGSLEPFSITTDFLKLLKDTPQFCPHFHVPLQSGDDPVLQRMNRGYTADGFARMVEKARKVFGEDLHVSTDLLVGFPGEDQASFERTLRRVEKMGFGKLHVFPFSPREGTPAFSWSRPPKDEVKLRCALAGELGKKLLRNYASRWVGSSVTILVERRDSQEFYGHTPHFLEVRCSGKARSGEERICQVTGQEDGVLHASSEISEGMNMP